VARHPKSWREGWERIEWASDNFDQVQIYVVQRLAAEFAEELGAQGELLHLIKVSDGRHQFFGVSLEPKPYQEELAAMSDKLLLASGSDEEALHRQMMAANPWVYDKLPAVFDSPEEGYFYVRDTTSDEMEVVAIRNDEEIRDLGAAPVPASTRTWFVDDIRFNMLRGEFGLGDNGQPMWRPALRRLIRDRLPAIQEEVMTAMFEAKLTLDAPAFETRSPEWLKANEEFAVMMVQTTAV